MKLAVSPEMYRYVTSIRSIEKIKGLILKDSEQLTRNPTHWKELKFRESLKSRRLQIFEEWLKVLEGKSCREEFDRSVYMRK